jgi:hypothetical protein
LPANMFVDLLLDCYFNNSAMSLALCASITAGTDTCCWEFPACPGSPCQAFLVCLE